MILTSLALSLLLGCPPADDTGLVTIGEDTDTDTDTDTDSDSDSDADTDSDADADYFEPVAVGVELNAGWDATTGALPDFTFDGNSFSPAYVILTFASIDYFGAGDTAEQEANDCKVYALFPHISSTFETLDYDTDASLPAWNAWEGYVEFGAAGFEADDPEGNCTNWDPSIFPGGDPVETFSGMHLGIAYGDFSDYLAQAWSESVLEEYGDSMFTQFIAVNHPDGSGGYTFESYNWTTGFLWEMDLTSGLVSSDKKGFLIPEISFGTGGFTTGSPYWFEDFPNLDYSLMKEGVPDIPEE